ncbi:hypothetical protein [Ensifer sp. NM-2]|uniref:hypothetical protein n=1 Tax=Ensifer sp. NM-2 TaxID=2109730 RepID=UPI001304B378|nr:hypothetical protein [Ensifer sp. NM-2]
MSPLEQAASDQIPLIARRGADARNQFAAGRIEFGRGLTGRNVSLDIPPSVGFALFRSSRSWPRSHFVINFCYKIRVCEGFVRAVQKNAAPQKAPVKLTDFNLQGGKIF